MKAFLTAGVFTLALLLTTVSELQAAPCHVTDFTAIPEIPNPNYYTPRPYSLSPDSGGTWDCFARCGTGAEIQVIDDPAGGGNQVCSITGAGGNLGYDVLTRRTITPCNACGDGTFTISLRVKAGAGGGTLWRISFGTGSTTHAKLQGSGLSFFGKAGASRVTPTFTLTGPGTFDNVLIHADTQTRLTEYYVNGTLLGVLNHDVDGTPGNQINRFEIEQIASSTGNVILDDVTIEPCRTCHTNVAPKTAKETTNVSGPFTPATIVYNINNYGTTGVTYTAQEVLANGTPNDYPWMQITSGAGGGLPTTGSNANVVVGNFSTTGTVPGQNTGYILFTDTCGSPFNSYIRQVNLWVGEPASCATENFDALTPASALLGQGGWTGGNALVGEISVATPGNGGSGNAAQITFGPSANPSTTVTRTINCPGCLDSGIITVYAKIKGQGTGGGNAWRMHVADANGVRLGSWQGQGGNCIIGRAGGGGNDAVTACNPISTTSFDELKLVIDTVNKTTDFIINNVSKGKFANNADILGQSSIGTGVGSLTLEHINRADILTGSVLLDDFRVLTCDSVCGIKILPDENNRPLNYSLFSAAVQNDPGSLDPASWDFKVTNTSPSSLNYSVVKSDISGTPSNAATWLTLNNSGGSLLPEGTDLVTATVDITGLVPGEYVGYLKFTDTCTPVNSYQLRTVRLVVIAPDTPLLGHTCLIDSFTVPDGNLTNQMGWIGTAGTAIKVTGGTVRISNNAVGGVGAVNAVTTVPDACLVQADCANQNSLIVAKMKMQGGGVAGGNVWQIQFMDESTPVQQELARFYRTGNVVAGRIGGVVTDDVTLTTGPGFDTLEARINVSAGSVGGIAANSTKFFVNGVPFPALVSGHQNPIAHPGIAGDIVTQISVQRTGATATGLDFILLDDVQVDYCVPQCNDPVFDVRDISFNSAPDTYVDEHDFQNGFLPCVTGPTPALSAFNALSFECQCMDLNHDLAIDARDFAVFQRCYTGAPPVTPGAVAVDPNCDN